LIPTVLMAEETPSEALCTETHSRKDCNTTNGPRSSLPVNSASVLALAMMPARTVSTSTMSWVATGYVSSSLLCYRFWLTELQNMPANYDEGVFENCDADNEYVPFPFLLSIPRTDIW